MLSDRVIEDAIERFPDLADKSVVSIINDSATPTDAYDYGFSIKRNGWTSEFAKRLGYKLHPQGNWYKIYRELELVPV